MNSKHIRTTRAIAALFCATSTLAIAQECIPTVLDPSEGIHGLYQETDDNFPIGYIHSLAFYDSGSGPELYAAGKFNATEDENTFIGNGIARWDGSQWNSLLGGVIGGGGNTILSMSLTQMFVWDDGSGEELYIGGNFNFAGGVQTDGIVKWDGTQFHSIADGVHTGTGPISIADFVPFDDGTGEALYIIGGFSFVDNGPFLGGRIAKWDGTSLTQVAGGGSQLPTASGRYLSGGIAAAAVYDDGTGEAIYLAGSFSLVDNGNIIGRGFAKWDGTELSPLGNGLFPGTGSGTPEELFVFDDGSGSKLYTAGSSSVNTVSRWDGTSWEAINTGLPLGTMYTLNEMDLGDGSALYGFFADILARWNGSFWETALGGTGTGAINSFVQTEEDGEPVVYAAGDLSVSNINGFLVETNNIIKIALCDLGTCPADFTGDGSLDIFDVFAFLDAFNAGDLVADFTGDGSLDIFDVFAFLDEFNAGCP